jgi:hypothetical protein
MSFYANHRLESDGGVKDWRVLDARGSYFPADYFIAKAEHLAVQG